MGSSVADPSDDAATIATAEQFARDLKQPDGRIAVALAAIWAVVAIAVMAWVAFLVWQVTSQHTERERNRDELKARQVTVWCYADPNSDRATSSFTGSADEVKGRCPDAYGGYR